MLGNVKMTSATSDDVILNLLETEKYDVVTFAPGACRYDAARQPIPGGNSASAGWNSASAGSLEQYHALVREKQATACRSSNAPRGARWCRSCERP